MKTVLITGSAGFIGYHAGIRFLNEGYRVVGVDNLSDYYDVSLKESRQEILKRNEGFHNVNASIQDPGVLSDIFKKYRPNIVIHLAAQAGVRFSIESPRSYLDSNICGTFELLEAARMYPPEHMLLASTSSVFGANKNMPYTETDKADHQLSFYAATKKATEAMAHSYAHIFGLPITMFRFFTVYGPWGRPDMALFKFTKSILNNEAIDVYNYGDMKRDFTYIDDLVEAIFLLTKKAPINNSEVEIEDDSISPVAPWRVVNIGNSNSVLLTDFITAIEKATGIIAKKNLMPMQAGDVPATWANANLLKSLTSYAPRTSVDTGVSKFVDWYRSYYEI